MLLTELFFISLTWGIVVLVIVLAITIALYSYYNHENEMSYNDKFAKEKINELEKQLEELKKKG